MRFHPATKRLYTGDGRFLKQLDCPIRQNWHKLATTEYNHIRQCDHCEHTVTDTAALDEDSLVALLQTNPDACLKVSRDQVNVIFLSDHNA